MIDCRVALDPEFTIAPVPPRLFGSFVEHMGRGVYGGIYEPGHPNADVDGLRTDVLDLVRELGVSVVRYPGGNFVSGYRWEDGVGPPDQRPTRLDLAWHSLEPNTFGLHEFMHWAGRAGVEPMLAVNLGTRGISEAVDLVDYANHPAGTRLSDLRIANGRREPFAVARWCLGNEMDGPWQIGHKTADEYGRLAAETAKAMKLVDPSIELVACGSSNAGMPTFGRWEDAVLEHAYEYVDYLSLHAYVEPCGGDRLGFLASALAMDEQIDATVATCDAVAARKRTRRRLRLSFDEWNVWYQSRFGGSAQVDWTHAPRLIEDEYTATDAVVVGNLLMSLVRHSDRVAVACLAQLVNVIAPIRAEPDVPAWRQATFYPFALTARHARGDVLRVQPRTSMLNSPTRGDVPAVDVVATRQPEAREMAVFAVNRCEREPARLEMALPGDYTVVEHVVIGGRDLDATNAAEAPERVVPRASSAHRATRRTVTAQLPPVSWTMVRLAPRPA